MKIARTSASTLAILFASVATLAAACGGSSKGSGFGGGADGDGGLLGDPDGGGFGSSGGAGLLEAGCAVATADTQRAPVYMQIVLDGSGSMGDDNKWTSVVPALKSIFDDLQTKADPTFAVGLVVFSDSMDPCASGFGSSCTYPSSADVRIAAVDSAQHSKLVARIQGSPELDTPTRSALEGSFKNLEGFKPTGALPPNGKKVLVLMTDGVPTDGSDMNSNSALVAAELAKGNPQGPITTFAVGIGPFPSPSSSGYDPIFMGHIAKAGGAAPSTCNQDEKSNVANVCHFQVTPGGKTPAQLTKDFVDAINKIRGAVATCEFVLDKSGGGSVDPSQVNVIYTDLGGVEHVLVQDPQDGWTYDDPNNPTRVILHGTDCDEVKNDPKGKISIVLGCKTVTK